MGDTFFLGTRFKEERSQRHRTSGLSLLTAGGGDPVSMVITYREAKRERVLWWEEVKNRVRGRNRNVSIETFLSAFAEIHQ